MKVKQGAAVYAKFEQIRQNQAPCPTGNSKENNKCIACGVLHIIRVDVSLLSLTKAARTLSGRPGLGIAHSEIVSGACY